MKIKPFHQVNTEIIDSLKYQKKHTNFKQLKATADSTIKTLSKVGYINILQSPLKKVDDSTYLLEARLGKKYRTAHLMIHSKDSYIDSIAQITLSRKRSYTSISNIDHQIDELYTFLKNKGYPFTKITTQTISANKDTIDIKLNISTKQTRFIDNIRIKGYPKFPKKYIEEIIKKHYVLNNKNLNLIKSKLNKISFIKTQKEPELLFKKDSTILYVYIAKKRNNLIDGLIGFNNNDGEKLEINGTLDLLLINNLNNGEELKLLYRGDDKDQTQLDLNIETPYLFKTNIGLSAGINILRRDSTYQNSTINGGLFYSFNPQTKGGLKYSSTNSSTMQNDNNSINYNSRNFILTLNHLISSNDDLFQYEEYANLELGNGIRTTDNEENKQLRLKAQLKKNISINHKHSLNIESQLLLLNSDNIVFNELFQVGGINSIRGFNQNSIDTSFFTSINTEYRYRISNGIYLHSILDYGIFEEFNSQKTQNIYGIGVGTAILTQSGILRLSIANGSFSGANLDLSSTVAHINLKISF